MKKIETHTHIYKNEERGSEEATQCSHTWFERFNSIPCCLRMQSAQVNEYGEQQHGERLGCAGTRVFRE